MQQGVWHVLQYKALLEVHACLQLLAGVRAPTSSTQLLQLWRHDQRQHSRCTFWFVPTGTHRDGRVARPATSVLGASSSHSNVWRCSWAAASKHPQEVSTGFRRGMAGCQQLDT
jgi:hypothetical protein